MTKPPPRGMLAGFATSKPVAEPIAETMLEPVAPLPKRAKEAARGDGRKGITLRLDPAVMRQLGQIALDEDVFIRDLVVEGINRMLKHRKLPPIAS